VDIYRKHIGANIRAARKALGLSQAELAAKVGVEPPTVSRWETGKDFPGQERLPALCEALSVSQRYFDPTFKGFPIGTIERTVISHGSAAPTLNPGLELVSKFANAPPDIHYLVQAILDEDPAYLMRLTPEFVSTLRRLLERLE
jgi:transcriptional regulator with XRE-family HTH domain